MAACLCLVLTAEAGQVELVLSSAESKDLFSRKYVADPVARQEANDLLMQLQSARESFWSGAASVTGHRIVVRTARPQANVDHAYNFFYAFDQAASDGGSLRCDAYVPTVSGSVTASDLTDSEDINAAMAAVPREAHVQRISVARNSNYVARFEDVGESRSDVQVMWPDAPLHGISDSYHLIDIRSVGLIDLLQFDGTPHVRLAKDDDDATQQICLLDEMLEIFRSGGVVSIDRQGPLAKILFTGGRTLTVDTSKDCSPVLLESDLGGHMLRAEVDWTEVNDTWVPAKWTLERSGSPEPADIARYQFTFSWANVNEGVDPGVFTFQQFEEMPSGTSVVDQRMDPAVDIGSWNEGEYQPVNVPLPLKAPSSRSRSLFVVANVALLILLAIWVGFRFAWNARTKTADDLSETVS